MVGADARHDGKATGGGTGAQHLCAKRHAWWPRGGDAMVSADAWHGGETTGGGAGHTTQSGDRKATQKDEDLLA
jgi:hypothetical protein